MNPWLLPGPARFLRRVERSLREGVSVVVRFPGKKLAGLRGQVLAHLHGSLQCTVFRPEPAWLPFESIRNRFAPQLSTGWGPRLLDLCEQHEFQGRLIWVDGLDGLDRGDWRNWKQFLVEYAQASRGVREFERTLFVVVVAGSPPADPPERDVTLTTHDWRDVVDEMDLPLFVIRAIGAAGPFPHHAFPACDHRGPGGSLGLRDSGAIARRTARRDSRPSFHAKVCRAGQGMDHRHPSRLGGWHGLRKRLAERSSRGPG